MTKRHWAVIQRLRESAGREPVTYYYVHRRRMTTQPWDIQMGNFTPLIHANRPPKWELVLRTKDYPEALRRSEEANEPGYEVSVTAMEHEV